MNTILNRIDRLMMGITFAEANEPELAQECLGGRETTQSNRAQQSNRIPDGQIVANQTAH